MIVLQINSVFKKGSTGKIVYSIHELLTKLGHKSFVAFGRDGKQENLPFLIRIGADIDVYMHGLLTRNFDLHGYGSGRATLKFIKAIEKLKPDVIHLHNIHGYYLNVFLLFEYLKKSKAKVLWTLHDCWPFTGHCAYFDYIGCDKWKSHCFKCPQINRYPKSMLIDNSALNYKAKKEAFTGLKDLTIVVPSKWLSSLVKESFLKEYPVEIITNGVDLDIFRPLFGKFKQRYDLENKFIILGVANVWEDRKGIRYFYELEKYLMKDEMIVIVGRIQCVQKYKSSKIKFIERTDNQEQLAEIYSSADVFVNPTLEDNFPSINLEALACGTPIVTFNSGGAGEAVVDECGFVINKGDVKKMMEAIRHIKDRGKDTYTESCLKRAREYYSDKIMSLKYLKLYEQILQK